MDLQELLDKYGNGEEIEDWKSVSHDDLYSYLDEGREGIVALSESGKLDSQIWAQEVKRRCKEDLEWLAGYFTHESNPETAGHPISANMIRQENVGPFFDFFVKKDSTKSLAEQDTIKNRLLLYPRGAMKSSTGLVDLVQWVLNFPEIRILIMTAADDLAVAVLDETKGHFLVKTYEPSLMNMFFPEFCVEEKDMGDMYSFTCPVWARKQIKRREATIMATSITSTMSGFHFEVIHTDDIVSNRNSENDDQCASTNKKFKINKKMLRPFGYCTKIGTRYHDADMYGLEIENNVGDLQITSGPGWEMTRNEVASSLILIGRAITVKPEVRAELSIKGVPPSMHYQEAGPDGCILVIPKVLSYARLLSEYNSDKTGERKEEGTFEGQMNQNPMPETEAVFDMPMLLRSTVPFHDLPFRGPITHTWDLAFKGTSRDFTAGCSVIWNEKGQGFVHDLVRDRFPTPTAMAKAIVKFAVDHHPQVIGIEDAAGSRFIEATIISEAAKTGDPWVMAVCGRIDWIKIDNQKNAKQIRMAALQPLLVDGYLKFANYLPHRDILYLEFMRCQVSKSRNNDIPDVISYQPRYAPRMLTQIITQGIPSWSREQAMYNMLYEENTDPWGRVGGGGVNTLILGEPKFVQDDIVTQSYAQGLDNILGGGLIG